MPPEETGGTKTEVVMLCRPLCVKKVICATPVYRVRFGRHVWSLECGHEISVEKMPGLSMAAAQKSIAARSCPVCGGASLPYLEVSNA